MTTGENIDAEDEIPERHVGPMTRLEFARISVATDDPNRVHIEESVAKATGLPDVIGSGGIVIGLLTDVVTAWAGLESLCSANMRIVAPIFPSARLRTWARVVTKREADGLVEVEGFVEDDSGNPIGQGTFLVRRS